MTPWNRRTEAATTRSHAGLVAALSLFAVIILSPSAPGLQQDPRYQIQYEPRGDWLVGNLTWNQGKGGISWQPDPPTEPLGGYVLATGETRQANSEFRSDPLPHAAYIDASRSIWFTLAVENAEADCPGTTAIGLSVRVLANGQLMAGSAGEQTSSYFPEKYPPGFGICRYRMPTEITYLPAQSSITIWLNWTQDSGQRFGMAPTVFKIPVFEPHEAIYRMPEILPRSRLGDASAPGESVAPVVPAVPLVALSLSGLFVRRNRRTLAVLGLLVGVAFAGCLSGTSPTATDSTTEPQGEAVVQYLDPGDTGLGAAGAGSLLGQLRDVSFLPVTGAHVALLGTGNFSSSDRDGFFQFPRLPPSTYRLRVDHPDFRSFEQPVVVVASQIAQVDIELRYNDGVEVNDRAHRHDYWNGAESSLVLDAEVPGCAGSGDCLFYVPQKTADAWNLIRPGTNDVEVRLHFDPAEVGYEKLGLMVQDNEDTYLYNWTAYVPRGPDAPFHVRTTWEMTDVGHQKFSTWTFRVYALSADSNDDALEQQGKYVLGSSYPALSIGAVRATVKIHRGAVPLEPAHPDHWVGQKDLNIEPAGSWEIGIDFQGLNVLIAGKACLDGPGGVQYERWGRPVEYYLLADLGKFAKPVPSDATNLRLKVVFNRPTGFQGQFAYDWNLLYRSGEREPVEYVFGSTTHKAGPTGTKASDGVTWTWDIPVTSTEADGIYNKKSSWNLVVVPSDMDAACRDATAHAMDINDPNAILAMTYSIKATR